MRCSATWLIGKPLGEDAIDADRTWKKKYGDPLDLLVAGDSIAAGLGARPRKQTPRARLAPRAGEARGRAVRAGAVGGGRGEGVRRNGTRVPSAWMRSPRCCTWPGRAHGHAPGSAA